MSHRPANLPQLFAESRRWFEDALFASMEAAGEQPVTSTQASVFALLDDEGTTVSELARRIGVTRQTAHQVVHALIGMHLLEQVPDPGSARRILIRTTAEGRRVHERAQATIAVIESVLADRIGAAAVDVLRQTLTADWGEPPLIAAP
ncbi:MarR family winged helix-turn-helix transcriptional regulator [Streptomyces sp. MBT33]|uniref:MarR family winged helix-turn-helix transcriptional regulator n=1 Tax=unclassified Streptomyces TaxID=2593676 RepID=UPI001F3ABFE0|nr:MarR family transcriptional regulator [Streptomyces sp. MBT33]